MRIRATLIAAISVAGISAARPVHLEAPAERIAPNDNRRPAGKLTAGVLTVRLEARNGVWQPDGPSGPLLTTAAFAEVGKALANPGPLLRASVGTEIRATVRNALTKPLWLYGMGATRGLSDSLLIEPGATREVRFHVSEAGAYYYLGRTEKSPVLYRETHDSQLGGLIIVDAAGSKASRAERFFAITTWGEEDDKAVSGVNANTTFAFNGLSWPLTERFEYTQGDSVHWRFVNISAFDHPLHLHGFYFQVTAKGDARRDTVYTAAERRMAVTEQLTSGQTTALTWSPERSGNWVFHCHFAGHIAPFGGWDTDRSSMKPQDQGVHGTTEHRMRGLVFLMKVKPRGSVTLAGTAARPIRLVIRSKANVYGDYVGYSYVLGGSQEERDSSAMRVPGSVLELTRGERVAITIVNRTHEGAAVHWHGIELESYPDGVAGISGEGKNILPMIPSGDSLTVRFTPPRAGTFMYHSHSNEFQQIASGLYGALIVREPGEPRDPNERLLILSDGGPIVKFTDPSKFPPVLLNGQSVPTPIDITGGVPVRFRLISIRSDFGVDAALLDGDKPVEWRIVAKDGMPTPPLQSAPRPAKLSMGSGEIYDLEVVARSGTTLTFKYGDAPTLVPVRVH